MQWQFTHIFNVLNVKNLILVEEKVVLNYIYIFIFLLNIGIINFIIIIFAALYTNNHFSLEQYNFINKYNHSY
jgi:hypothetical protein